MSQRRRRKFSDNVQHCGDSLSALRIESEHRNDFRRCHTVSQTFIEFPVSKDPLIEVFIHQFFVGLCNQFVQSLQHLRLNRIAGRYADRAEFVPNRLHQLIEIISILVLALYHDKCRLLQFFAEIPRLFRSHLDTGSRIYNQESRRSRLNRSIHLM